MTKKPRTEGTAVKKKKDAVWERLANELRKIIPKLDSEGLAFLVEQSRIHLYNMQVDKLNKMKEAAFSARAVNSGQKPKAGAKPAAPSKGKGIKIDPTSAGYYLRGPKGGSMFSKNEMVQMIKIVNSPGSNPERAGRLYSWLAKERSDVLGALQAKDKSDGQIQALAAILLKNYQLKK